MAYKLPTFSEFLQGLNPKTYLDANNFSQNLVSNTPIVKYDAPLRRASSAISPATSDSSTGDSGTSQYEALQAQIDGLRNSLPRPPQIPKLDINGIYDRAKQVATSNVSPYYENLFQQFKADQTKQQERAQQDTNTIITQADQDLKTALDTLNQSAATNTARTQQDTTQAIGDVNTQQNQYQQDSATGFSRALNNLRSGLANSGLTFSGIGQQQTNTALQDKATQEGRSAQAAQTNVERLNQNKDRTLQDIATEVTNKTAAAQTGTQRTKDQANLNLTRLNQDLLDQEVQKRQELDFQKSQDIYNQTQGAAKNLFTDFLTTLKSPEQIAAASSAYGGLF
jgi:hypothetical protein